MYLKKILNLMVLLLFTSAYAQAMKQVVKKKNSKFFISSCLKSSSLLHFYYDTKVTLTNLSTSYDIQDDELYTQFNNMKLEVHQEESDGNSHEPPYKNHNHDPHESHEDEPHHEILAESCDPNNGIHSYKEEYEPALREMALQDAARLATTTIFTQEEFQRLYDENIAPAFRDERTISKVYLVDGKPVGFINYTLYTPFYQKLIKQDLGPNAVLEHILVNKQFRKHGYGHKLMTYALEDCKKKNVNKVSFWTTSYSLDNFFRSFGFFVFRRTKLGEVGYMVRLKKHPIKLFYDEMCKKLK